MALTAAEEAQTREILAQQAAILSLADSEAEIISNLGASDVSLSDLTPAAAVSDSDLFLIRQGATDKSVTASIAKSYAQSGLAGRLLNVQVFTASGTYTKTAGCSSVIVEVIGGGGGGGGVEATGSSQGHASSGGGSGGYSMRRITSGISGVAVTIGAAGLPGYISASAPGGTGGTSSFGALVSATGGEGGAGISVAAIGTYLEGALGGTGVGGDLNVAGQCSQSSWSSSSASFFSNGSASKGGDSMYGAGGRSRLNARGLDAYGYGAGGGGSITGASQGRQRGGYGTAGLVIVWEYA